MQARHLDVYLLRCLVALVAEGHVTRAAERMGITQPAMSATLARLRTLFADPLLVRTEKGMVTTQRARQLADQFQQALDLVDQAVADRADFDPATATERFRIAASETLGYLLMPSLIAQVRRLAPSVQLTVQPPDLARVRHDLEEGSIDLLVAFIRNAPPGLRFTPLMRQPMRVIAAAGHPEVQGRLSRALYVGYPHVFYALGGTGGSTLEAVVDEALERAGLVRTIGARVSSTLVSPGLVAQSDLLATLPERIARHFAAVWQLQVLEPPVPLEDVSTSMFWHERKHHNPAHRWLRQQFEIVARSTGTA
ncbi:MULTISPECIES: LysR family transcriptional regulator [unclassified Variovorax]|uniref:LysR family transcriptional regulator n=1 Tax=unclassified Variovorax TaxID=663243 RepID=UPI00076BFED5|nr:MULTISPECIES: LysR family transcriptional regulator [unclassified Variovorax]KWT95832.1 putative TRANSCRIPTION REGULATOR PROTEIN [Variovorax sp. WDL1]PNG58863.1 HTH-type transcriptional regulator LeuO [Variovorax sp. B4]PNG61347.1 HTH-type transcriptional regulator LeuO [Variovorax sp. B2]VTV12656.1 HTH-type transcriptional regulator LeuO [Variovorax sp. WDL1]